MNKPESEFSPRPRAKSSLTSVLSKPFKNIKYNVSALKLSKVIVLSTY